MRITIEHEVPGRLRVRLAGPVPSTDLDPLTKVILACPDVRDVTIYPRIGSLAVCYGVSSPDVGAPAPVGALASQAPRERVLAHLAAIDAEAIEAARREYTFALAPRTHALFMDIAKLVGFHYLRRWFLPKLVTTLYAVWRYRSYLAAALRSLAKGRLDVPVLDAAAIGISFIKGDPATAGSTMFLLDLGETLEDYTRAQSENQLIYSLLAVPDTAQLVEGDEERTVPATELRAGDLIAIRTGMPVPIDGVVEGGCAMVNQAAMTGEPLAVERSVGDDVFAGTACEDGQIFVRVKKAAGDTKLRSIVSLVEQSEGLKAQAQSRRERLADAIVPWNFLLAGIVALTTRSLIKTSAALMVDYSCALKLTGSIAVLTAMSQSAREGFTVKGSKHFEAYAQADTIVFDKTGTLTDANPKVACVMAFDGWNETEVLRFAACLEEHFPHPVARAVVRAAAERGLAHRERHAEVEYIVAHGIASSLEGERVVIGSEHFVVEDEGVPIPEADRARIAETARGLSTLYLAVNGELVGALGIEDPLKEGVAQAVSDLRALGFEHIVMLTGDNERAAARIAQEAGITEFRANMLPEGKHAFVEELRAAGRHVVMVGDGVNDSPALSTADVGVAMANGTAIAKEVADITLTSGDLAALVRLRRLSQGLMGRLDATFTQVLALNSAFLAAGIAGAITPQTSSLLHNGSTIALSMRSSKSYPVE